MKHSCQNSGAFLKPKTDLTSFSKIAVNVPPNRPCTQGEITFVCISFSVKRLGFFCCCCFYQFLKGTHLCLTQISASIIPTVHSLSAPVLQTPRWLFIMCDMQTVDKGLWICKKKKGGFWCVKRCFCRADSKQWKMTEICLKLELAAL